MGKSACHAASLAAMYSPTGLLLLDDKMLVEHADQRFCRLFGCDADALVGCEFIGLLSPKDRKGAMLLHSQLIAYAGGEIDLMVGLRLQRKDTYARLRIRKEGIHWLVFAEPMYEGDLTYDLFWEHARWTQILKSSTEGVLILDQHHKITEFNENFLDMMMFRSAHDVILSENSLLGKDVFSLLDPLVFAEFQETLEGRTQPMFPGMQLCRTLQLGERHIEVLFAPIFLPIRGFVGSCLLFRDLTEGLKAEVLQREADVARQANEAKSAFLANVSHELRTPLNAIIGYAELLQEDALEEARAEVAGDLGKISSSANHLLHLINDILDLSKIEAGKLPLVVESFSVADELAHVQSAVQASVEKNGNTLLVEIPADLGSAETDRTRLRQILFNPIANACKFTKDGQISFRSSRFMRGGEPWLLFQIQDTGVGMSEAQLARIFEPFVQAEASITRRFGGTGLGLSITRHLCRLLGGTVELTSQLGEGTLCTIALPARAPVDSGGGSAKVSGEA